MTSATPPSGQPPDCRDHNTPCVIRQVKKEGPNKGRCALSASGTWFYVCSMTGDSCNTFIWADQRSVGASSRGFARREAARAATPKAGSGRKLVTLQLVSPTRFGAAGQYDAQHVDLYKEHASVWHSAWDPTKYLWTFDLDRVEVSLPSCHQSYQSCLQSHQHYQSCPSDGRASRANSVDRKSGARRSETRPHIDLIRLL
eukprot:4310369-Pyramimonas_sp.AAC.1